MAEEKKLKYPNLTDFTVHFVDKKGNSRHNHVLTVTENGAKNVISNTFKRAKIESVHKNKKKY